MLRLLAAAAAAFILFAPTTTKAQESDEDLAKQVQNPVASLISVPLQNNFDCCVGPDGGYRDTLNVQPVVPFAIGGDLSLIVRTILPVIDEARTAPNQGGHFGIGDVTQSFFFAPPPTSGGLIFAAGPAFIWPTGGAALGSEKWSAGPTFVVLKQSGPITAGLLANQLWSYAGSSHAQRVSAVFLQPFFSYTFADTTALSLNTESSYDWVHRQWTVPVDAGFSRIFKVGGQRVQLGVTGRYFATSPDGPQAGVRMTATFLFPK